MKKQRLRNKMLINNEKFHKDFIKEIKSDIDHVTSKLVYEESQLDKLIKTIVGNKQNINNRYIIDGYLVFNTNSLESFLLDYNNTKLHLIKPVSKVNGYFKIMQHRLKDIVSRKYNINVYKADIKELNNCLFSLNEFKDITILYNEWSMRNCLNGGTSIFAKGMGTINVLNVHKNFKNENTKLKVDHKRSNDYKNHLLSVGKVPYSKSAQLAAKAKGEPYKGEDWLIFYYDETYPYINWYKGNRINTIDYKFVPLSCNNTFATVAEAADIVKNNDSVDELFSYNLGFVNNLNILKNSIPGYLNKLTRVYSQYSKR